MPLVFTQEGVSMLSSVLRSDRAIQVNIAALGQHTDEIRAVFEAIRQLISPPKRRRPRIGFKP